MVPVAFDVPLAGFTPAVNVTGEFCAMDEADAVNVVVVLTVPEFTFTVMALEVDALKVLFPAYSAVIEFDPAAREDVEREAEPAESEAVPSEVPPLKKVTVPLGAVEPLLCFTDAVSVTGEFSLIVEADEERVVVVPITAGFAFTVSLIVAECTRSPLTAHTLTGTVCAAELDDAVSVRIEYPLVRLGLLKDAVTPAGSPDTLRFTAPKLNDSTRTVAVARPDVMV